MGANEPKASPELLGGEVGAEGVPPLCAPDDAKAACCEKGIRREASSREVDEASEDASRSSEMRSFESEEAISVAASSSSS